MAIGRAIVRKPELFLFDEPLTNLGAPGATPGIRPEHLTVSAKVRLDGKITHVVRLGGDANLLVTTGGGETVTVRLFGQHAYQVDDIVALWFENRQTFTFNQDGICLKNLIN